MKGLFVVALVLGALVHCCLSAPADAEITSLPGLTQKLNFRHYGGYINVNAAAGRNLYYWFVESQSKPSTDPLFLWMQGGPGCSSLFGFFAEHGPFQISPNLEVQLNPYAWNRRANVLYLESPAGVGFSYHNSGSFSTGDNETMSDAYIFLQSWFKLYPEFANNAFYVSGESYGGHYVPQLSWTILHGNKNATSKINLKGMLVGNPWTDNTIDTWSIPPFIYYHHLCSLPTWESLLQYCIDNTTDMVDPMHPSFSLIDSSAPFSDREPRRLRGVMDECDDALNQMYTEIGNDINQYDIYFPCVGGGGVGLDCSNYTAETDFLNSPAVQAAIHAKKPVLPWSVCADELMENIKVTVYGGDVTFNVPVLGTQVWVEGFQRKIISDYQSWLIDGQVAGYYKKFDGITYVSVKNSGHMVPEFTPLSGLVLLENYLEGTF